GAPKIPEMGGLAVVIGFYVGVNVLTVWGENGLSSSIFYLSLLAVLGAAVTGIMDDLFSLRQRVKALLPFIFAIPLGSLMVETGDTVLLTVDFGILMLFIAPFGITSAANATNMLEGFNGLGAGMGIIITSAMIALSVALGRIEGLFLLLPLLGALVAFLWFNRYPAKIFPGDSMTLFVGATVACAAIIANLKTFGAVLFIPMIVEFFLKARGHFKGENYGTIEDDGDLSYDGRTESLAHVIMKRRRVNERQLVYILWGIEIVVSVIVVAYALLTMI
ncbi:MAG: UDP-N-acetylglucosamine--dolichyl-phosphate N-acetylglucosaminephosphotransferase, partial [Thermoplasmata archaeon]